MTINTRVSWRDVSEIENKSLLLYTRGIRQLKLCTTTSLVTRETWIRIYGAITTWIFWLKDYGFKKSCLIAPDFICIRARTIKQAQYPHQLDKLWLWKTNGWKKILGWMVEKLPLLTFILFRSLDKCLAVFRIKKKIFRTKWEPNPFFQEYFCKFLYNEGEQWSSFLKWRILPTFVFHDTFFVSSYKKTKTKQKWA